MLKKILIANRGEIACRVAATARRLDIRTVAVYSDADADAKHVAACDEAIHIGAAAARDSYLRADAILAAAKASGAQAVHPGYGFLSENDAFAEACAAAGIAFIGPPASAIRAMGSKSAAKSLMEKAQVPLVPGYHGARQEPEFLRGEAGRIGYPVLIKASAGGGGKGMRIVEKSEDFIAALASCQREALASFSDDRVLVEKYLVRPRHIEIQVFADAHGRCVYLFERDCSVQRRHQKVLEEAPAPGMTDARRRAMGEAAVAAAQAVGYVGAGTVEFIVDTTAADDAAFYFMEMNTRLQVEHPVTEMITGFDLVEWQLRVACGEPLPRTQEQLHIHGHAIEARIYAENPEKGFLPATGTLKRLRFPAAVEFRTGGPPPLQPPQAAPFTPSPLRGEGRDGGEEAAQQPSHPHPSPTAAPASGLALSGGRHAVRNPASPPLRGRERTDGEGEIGAVPASVRIDSGIREGDAITPYYDPMIAKLIVWGVDRDAALAQMRQALAETHIVGLATNVAFLGRVLHSEAFANADLDTGLIERNRATLFPAVKQASTAQLALAAAALVARETAAQQGGNARDPWSGADAGLRGWRMNGVALRTLMFESTAGSAELAIEYSRDGLRLVHDGRTEALTASIGGDETRIQLRVGEMAVHGHVYFDGEQIHVFEGGEAALLTLADPIAHAGEGEAEGGRLTAPMPGKVVAILVSNGAQVAKGTPLVVMEAMKMEHTIAAPADGIVEEIVFRVGDQVEEGAALLRFAAAHTER